MTSDLDIYRTANVLIREHGDDAALEAAQRADAMLEKGSLGRAAGVETRSGGRDGDPAGGAARGRGGE